MLPHALPSATWEFKGRRVDQHAKEWFQDKDVCMILEFRDDKDTLTKKVKIAYRSDLKAIKLQQEICGNSIPHPEGAGDLSLAKKFFLGSCMPVLVEGCYI